MVGSSVILDVKDGVAHVTLNRPEVHNAFDEHVIAQLTEVFDQIGERDDIHAVILRGNGKSFSAGGDMNWMKRAAACNEEQNYDDALKLARMLHTLYTLPQVSIAVIQGVAMGGGMGLACCCDIVIADKDAVFALSEVKIGLIPATIGPYVMAALGPRQCRRLFQTGERFDAQKAHEIGLVHEIAERPEDREYILEAVLKNIAANGPKAMRAAKKLAHDLSAQPLSEKLMKDTACLIAATRATDEAKEGLSAFLEKRKAGWVKAVVASAILLLLSSFTAFAQDAACEGLNKALAETMLANAAARIEMEPSEVSLKERSETEHKYIYSAYIYKAEYEIIVKTDDTCFPLEVDLVDLSLKKQ